MQCHIDSFMEQILLYALHRKGREPGAEVRMDAEMAARVAAKAEEIATTRMQSEAVQTIVEQRLREERARLEQKVAAYCQSQ